MKIFPGVPALLAVLFGTACADAAADRSDEVRRVLDVADARPVSADSVAILVAALGSPDPRVRAQAARSLGRLERPAVVSDLIPLLTDEDAEVRAEAANALGQAVHGEDPSEVRPRLAARLGEEPDDVVRGVLAHTLGRLRADGSPETAELLAEMLPAAGAARLGFARGFYHLTRQPAARQDVPASAVEALRSLAAEPGEGVDAARTRTLATASLGALGALMDADLERALADREPQVRREAIVALARRTDAVARAAVESGLSDPDAMVRYDALRVRGTADGCAAVDRALDDGNAHVALLAIDLSAGCPPSAPRVARLDAMADSLPDTGDGWHRAAHALQALAGIDAERVGRHLPDFVEHDDPFVRAWAARSAHGHVAMLQALAADDEPNVRIAALNVLANDSLPLARQSARDVLTHADGELAIVAAGILEGSQPDVVPALFDALDRLSAEARQTSRDPRAALLARIAELGTPVDSARLSRYVRDFDPAIAEQAAALLASWTEREVTAAPQLLEREAFPTTDELRRLAADTVVITMADGGAVRIVLLPWLAPANAARFARLADEGWYDGRTFHRVVPNFVVQGGSPGANEYLGAAAFSRDEVGLQGNWRGTVGLSTRGRDTGDAQIYINLVNNNRLDHDYTIFGEVVDGMAVVDRMLEGARVATVRRVSGR